MNLQCGSYYHLYNRTNNKELLFPSSENYLFFLRKFKRHLQPYCDIIAYCLMPTHFHFLMRLTSDNSQLISNQIAILLRSYTRAINKQYLRHGNLFQQNTKAKHIGDEAYLLTLLNYIHQNPIRRGLTKKLADWEYSSYPDLAGIRNGSLPDRQLLEYYFKNSDEFVRYSEEVVESVRKEYWI